LDSRADPRACAQRLITMSIVDRQPREVLKKPLKIYKNGDVREAPA